jgi:hypothetical protein
LEKPSAHKREDPALQKMKFKNILLFFLVMFALLYLDPDPIGIHNSAFNNLQHERCGVMALKIGSEDSEHRLKQSQNDHY